MIQIKEIESKQELREAWPEVLPRVEVVKRKARESWAPEYVYESINDGRAILHIARDEGRIVGIAVTQLVNDSDHRWVNLWILHGIDAAKYWPDVMAYFDRHAKALGVERIRFESKRRGWFVRAGHDFKPIRATFERVL